MVHISSTEPAAPKGRGQMDSAERTHLDELSSNYGI